METVRILAAFVVICLASHVIGGMFKRVRLPTITGYLLAGALAGSFALDLLPSEAAEDLRFVDEISLAVIAFVAGSELFVKELRARLRPILSVVGGVVAVSFALLTASIYALTAVVSFTQDLSAGARLATALLGATVLLALSPPSTIAVIKEVRARGTFTRTVLGITVVMDVVIIVLFAVMTSLASPLLTDTSVSASFVGLLALDLLSALGLGVAAGYLLGAVMSFGWHRFVKIGLVLALGFGIYELADFVKVWSTDTLGFEVYIEPLLISLIAGFFVTNFTRYRDEFDDLLHEVGPVVYVAFFTITGLALKVDLLVSILPVAMVLFIVRAIGIGIGSTAGSVAAREPRRFSRITWMALITQAGIALGLAREVAVQFPVLGDAFATLVISVVVVNEVLGPLFLKSGLRRAGEAHEPGISPAPGSRSAVILGVEGQSIALARSLQESGWRVIVADTDASHVERLAADDVDERHVASIDAASLDPLFDDGVAAVVAMLGDDEANAAVLEYALEEHGIERLVVRPVNGQHIARFVELGAFIVDPGSAMVSLLDQAITTPQSAALLMKRDPARTVAQVEVSNRDLDGVAVRDLRLPTDVLLLEMVRDASSVVVSGHTSLKVGDELTMIADPESLDEVRVTLSA
ncbi:MAG: cation:proton antiporter [Acidimicrobiia bacterium]|nr:cation:proton antiporter [Acidimicrobiia bacterium]MBT8214896.1 cation:proton antiporter [Acidimicrobiia bacterium]NNF69347.1 potassium transporter TrkA [Acidimicrobiia bacterium]